MFAEMTVEDNLRLASRVDRPGPWDIDAILELFPNLKSRRQSLAGNLSGGEQQATAIARALMTNPSVLLLDELSLGLSPLAVDRVYSAFDRLIASEMTIVFVEQDLNRVLNKADRIMCLLEGRIIAEGRASEMSRDEITSAYFGLDRTNRHGAADVL